MSLPLSLRRTGAMLTAVAVLLLGLTIASQASAASPAKAAGVLVFDNIPATLAGNIAALGYETLTATEFGSAVQLAGNGRVLDDITIVLSSEACETGTWDEGCNTTPGTSYTHPITVNVYAEITAIPAVTTLLATKTETVAVPYRPSFEPEVCDGTTQWYSVPDDTCFVGIAFTHTFSLTDLGVTLPDRFVIAVTFNTGTYGRNPTGNTTAGYNYLGVAMPQLPVYGGPTLGTEPEPDTVYLWDATTNALVNVPWTEEREENPGFRVSAHSALAATGSAPDLALAGLGGALALLGAMALVLIARRRTVTR